MKAIPHFNNLHCVLRADELRTNSSTADNSGFKKLGAQWLIEHSTSHQHLWWLDSFVLRNPQLLVAAKRYLQGYDPIERYC